MRSPIRRIGVLTSGGDCPGLNAVIRAVVKTAVYRYGIEVVGILDGFIGLVENRTRPLTAVDASNILTLGGTILGTHNKLHPLRYPVRRNGRVDTIDMTDTMIRHIETNALDAVIVIGGDGSLAIAVHLSRHGVPIVAIPKTIDNDVPECDASVGFDTAVAVATEAIDRVHTTAISHHRVMIVEVMGRHSGWLALYAGVASGSDVILIPEIPYRLDAVCAAVQERERIGKRFSIICVAEGAHPQGGDVVIQAVEPDSDQRIRLGGIGFRLADEIHARTGIECRAVLLGYIQRGGVPTPRDRLLATVYGQRAVDLAVQGRFGRMVTYRSGRWDTVDLARIAGRQRHVPPDHPLIAAARAVGTRFGDAP